MRKLTNNSNLLKCLLVAMAISIIWQAGPCLAAEKGAPLPAHYPEEFTAVGCIDRMDDDYIVVDDLAITYGRKVKFYISDHPNPVSLRYFRAGRKVGLVLNAKRQIESMWYMGRCR